MTRRRVTLVLVCEDRQQSTFTTLLFERMGWNKKWIRPRLAPRGKSAAEHWVRNQFVQELLAFRARKAKAATALVVMVDADNKSVAERIREFEKECENRNVPFPRKDEAVVIAVPKRNIETWIHSLVGEEVDETTTYPKLDRQRDCGKAARRLAEVCRSGRDGAELLPSLSAACEEYNQRLASRG